MRQAHSDTCTNTHASAEHIYQASKSIQAQGTAHTYPHKNAHTFKQLNNPCMLSEWILYLEPPHEGTAD